MNPSDNLSHLLQGWQPEMTAPPNFDHSVWSRLEAAEARKGFLSAGISEFFSFFARPSVAASAAMIALFAGLFLGGIQARSTQEEHYLQSLNPFGYHRHTR